MRALIRGRRFAAPLVLFATTSCSGLFGGNDSGGGAPTVDETRRTALLDEINARFTALLDADRPHAVASLAAWMQTLPDFTSVSVDDALSLTARFPDGLQLAVADDRADPTPTTASAPIDVPPPRPSASTPPPPSPMSLPTGARYVVLRALDASWDPIDDELRTKLDAAGYTEKTVDFTAEALSKANVLSDVGVLYLNTHGSRLGGSHFVYWTAEKVTAERTTFYRTLDPQQKKIAMFSAQRSTGVGAARHMETHYAITTDFVEAYLSPAKGALVFSDACESSSAGTSWMLDGAGSALGWSREIRAEQARDGATRFLGRWLGSPFQGVPADAPPFRPVSAREAFDELAAAGFLVGTDLAGERSVLVLDQDTPTWAVPSVRNLVFDKNDASHLFVLGSFGFTKSGVEAPASPPSTNGFRVLVGGKAATIVSADSALDDGNAYPPCPAGKPNGCIERIVVSLPDAGAGSAGDVQVVAGTSKGNVVPLTEWRGVVTMVNQIEVGCVVTLTMKLHLRADVHDYRLLGGALQDNLATIPAAPDTTVDFVYGGGNCTGAGSLAYSYDADTAKHLVSEFITPQFYWSGQYLRDHTATPPTPLIQLGTFWDMANAKGTRSDGTAMNIDLLPFSESASGRPKLWMDPTTYVITKNSATDNVGQTLTTSFDDMTPIDPPTATTAR